MKMMKWLTAAGLMMGLVMWAGCGKGGANTKAPKTMEVNGVQLALPELEQSLMTSTDTTVKQSAGKLARNLRYGEYPAIQDELTKLAANPSLTDDQKKLVATVQDQMKEVIAKQPTP